MADIITINTAITTTTIRDARRTLVRTIAELEAINIEVPASLLLAAMLLGHDAPIVVEAIPDNEVDIARGFAKTLDGQFDRIVDDRRKP